MLKTFDLVFVSSSLVPFMKVFSHDVLLGIMEKTKQTNVLSFVEECHSTIVSFDLCMSKGVHDVFALDITCLGSNWNSKHVTLGLFEASNIITHALVKKLTSLSNEYYVRNKIVTYVKDEGWNLNIMTSAFKSIVKCEV